MKIRYFILSIAILILSACAQTARAEQLANTSIPAGLVATEVANQSEAANEAVTQAEVTTKPAFQTETTDKIEARCFRNSEETQLLINSVPGYCVQYPVGYDIAFLNDMEIMLMKRSVLNAEDPHLFISVKPADGMTVEQVADKLVADYTVPGLEVKRVPLIIDQEPAIMLDGLTGEDPNRQVVIVQNDRIFHMTIAPITNSPDVLAQAEALYNTAIQSFTFHPETNLVSDCPPSSDTLED